MSEFNFQEFDKQAYTPNYGFWIWAYLLISVGILACSFYAEGAIDVHLIDTYVVVSNRQCLLFISAQFSIYWFILRYLNRKSKLPNGKILATHSIISALLVAALFYIVMQLSKLDFSEEINLNTWGTSVRLNNILLYSSIAFLVIQLLFTVVLVISGLKRSTNKN